MKGVSFARQFLAQLRVILDDAVVDNGQHARAVRMGMGIGIVGAAMGSPTSVTDTQRTSVRTRTIIDGGDEISNFACAAAQFERSSRGEDSDARGVIAAIFEFAQAIKQYSSNIGPLGADVADDTAHRSGILSILLRGNREAWRLRGPPGRSFPMFLPASPITFCARCYHLDLSVIFSG